jgi:integrase
MDRLGLGAVRRSGFGGVTFHTLRHGTAKLLLGTGVMDAVVVQTLISAAASSAKSAIAARA